MLANAEKQMILTKKFYCLLIFLLFFGGGCRSRSHYPTDDFLEQKFHARQAEFEKLVEMFQEDAKLSSLDDKGNALLSFDKKADLPENRLSEYKKILARLEIEVIDRSDYDRQIYLRVWNKPRFFMGGKSKYFVYSEQEIPETVDSLDEIYRSERDTNHMKKVEGNWYLYLDVW